MPALTSRALSSNRLQSGITSPVTSLITRAITGTPVFGSGSVVPITANANPAVEGTSLVLTFTDFIAPEGTYAASDTTPDSGGALTLTFTEDTYTYAWAKDGTPLSNGGDISGATTAELTVANVESSDAGVYSITVTNDRTSEEREYSINVTTRAPLLPTATNATITEPGDGYRYYTFLDDGSFEVIDPVDVEYLLVAGGGAGGQNRGGGGGAGGLLSGSTTLVANTSYPVVIGKGGDSLTTLNRRGANGEDSTALGLTAVGGGGGGAEATNSGSSGGSGGGGGGVALGLGGSGVSGQGFAGGNSDNGLGAGGGGASEVGQNSSAGKNGGDGVEWPAGSGEFYAGGGAGGDSGLVAVGGLGGGGDSGWGSSSPQSNAVDGTGGGGGGTQFGSFGTGGSGVFKIRIAI